MNDKKRTVREAAHYHTSIKEWPEDDRPREKMIKLGPAALSDAELMAIIIGSGSGRITAVDLAKRLMVDYGNLGELSKLSVAELVRHRGLGTARSSELVAAFELGRRMARIGDIKRITISGPADVVNYMAPLLSHLKREVFEVLLLNSANVVQKQVRISEGNLNASIVHPREVFKAAIDGLAASIILVHNHPSGNPEPSTEDKHITRQLVESGKIMGIPVHDHIIVAGSSYSSFAERGLL
jgi:DNA repair protein RadC